MRFFSWERAKEKEAPRANYLKHLFRAFAKTQSDIQRKVKRSEAEASVLLVIFLYKYSTYGLYRSFGREYLENEKVYEALDKFLGYGSRLVPIQGLGPAFWFVLYSSLIAVLAMAYLFIFIVNLKQKKNTKPTEREKKTVKFLAKCFRFYFWLVALPAAELLLSQIACTQEFCFTKAAGVRAVSLILLLLNLMHSIISAVLLARTAPLKGSWDPLGSVGSLFQLKIVAFSLVNNIIQGAVESPSSLSKLTVMLKNIIMSTHLLHELISNAPYFNGRSVNMVFAAGLAFSILRNFLRLLVVILDMKGEVINNSFEGLTLIVVTPLIVKVVMNVLEKKQGKVGEARSSNKAKLYNNVKFNLTISNLIKQKLQKFGPVNERPLIYREKLYAQGIKASHLTSCKSPNCFCKAHDEKSQDTLKLLEFIELLLQSQFETALHSSKKGSSAHISLLAATYYLAGKNFFKVLDHLNSVANALQIRIFTEYLNILSETQEAIESLVYDRKRGGKKALSPSLDHVFYYENCLASLEASMRDGLNTFDLFWNDLQSKIVSMLNLFKQGSRLLAIEQDLHRIALDLDSFVKEHQYSKLCHHKLMLGMFYYLVLNELAKGEAYLKGYQFTKSFLMRADEFHKRSINSGYEGIGDIFGKDLAVLKTSIGDPSIITAVGSEGCRLVLGKSSNELVGQRLEMLVPRILRDSHVEYVKNLKKTGRASVLRNYRDQNIFLSLEDDISQVVGLYIRFSGSLGKKVEFLAAVKQLQVPNDTQHIITTEKGRIDSVSRHLFELIFSSHSSDHSFKKNDATVTDLMPTVFQMCPRLTTVYRIFNEVHLSANPEATLSLLSERKQKLYQEFSTQGFEILLKYNEAQSGTISSRTKSSAFPTDSHSISGNSLQRVKECRCLCRIKDKVLNSKGNIMRVLHLKLIEERARTMSNTNPKQSKQMSHFNNYPENFFVEAGDLARGNETPEKDVDLLLSRKYQKGSPESKEDSSLSGDMEISEEITYRPLELEKQKRRKFEMPAINEPINEESPELEDEYFQEKSKQISQTNLQGRESSRSQPHESHLRSLNEQQGIQLINDLEEDKSLRGASIFPEGNEEQQKRSLISTDSKVKDLVRRESRNVKYFKFTSLGFMVSLTLLMLVSLVLEGENNDNVSIAYDFCQCSVERALSLLSIQKGLRVAYAHRKGIAAEPSLNFTLSLLRNSSQEIHIETASCDKGGPALTSSQENMVDVKHLNHLLRIENARASLFYYLADLIAKLNIITDSKTKIEALPDRFFIEPLLNNPNSIFLSLERLKDGFVIMLEHFLNEFSSNRKIIVGVSAGVFFFGFCSLLGSILVARQKLVLMMNLLVRLRNNNIKAIIKRGKLLQNLLEHRLQHGERDKDSVKRSHGRDENGSESDEKSHRQSSSRKAQKVSGKKSSRITKKQQKTGDYRQFHDRPYIIITKLMLLLLPPTLFFFIGFYQHEIRNQTELDILKRYSVIIQERFTQKKLDVALAELLMSEAGETLYFENKGVREYFQDLLGRSSRDNEMTNALNFQLREENLLKLISTFSFCFLVFEKSFCEANKEVFSQGYLAIRASKNNLLFKLFATYSLSDRAAAETRANLVKGKDYGSVLVLSEIDFQTLKFLQSKLISQQLSLNQERRIQTLSMIISAPVLIIYCMLFLSYFIVKKSRLLLETSRGLVNFIPCELILGNKFALANLQKAFGSFETNA